MTPTELSISLQIAVIAWTARNILMQPGMILHWYFMRLDTLVRNGREWAAKPLGYCDQCLSGQIAFWVFLLVNFQNYGPQTLFEHIFFVCFTVFVTYQLQRLQIHED